tara:strand:+ start:5031 stop:6509 length:1479 start_codon:yes stop_codon:yes gene_type:complete
MTKKKRTRIRQTPTDFQKVFAKHPDMVQSFSWIDRIPEFVHIAGALIENDFKTVKEDFYKISNYVNDKISSTTPFHFNLTHTLKLIYEIDELRGLINNSCFKNIFEQIILYYSEILEPISCEAAEPNHSLLFQAYYNILKGRSDSSIIGKYLMIEYSNKGLNFESEKEILEPQNVKSIMAHFPPSVGLSENIDLAKCEEIWMHNYMKGPIVYPPDNIEFEESIYSEIGMESIMDEFKKLYTSFKDINLLAIYSASVAETFMGFIGRICDLSIDIEYLVKNHKCEIAELTIRTVLESFIVFSWLNKRSDPKLIERFKDFSVGKEKLFSEKLVKKVDDKTPIDKETAEKIASDAIEKSGLNPIEVATERGDAFDLNIAQMADEVWGSENIYYMQYKRLSDSTHGSWRIIEKYHLTKSLNPIQNGLLWYSDNDKKATGLTPVFFGVMVSLKSMILISQNIDHESIKKLTEDLESFESRVSKIYLNYYKSKIQKEE